MVAFWLNIDGFLTPRFLTDECPFLLVAKGLCCSLFDGDLGFEFDI